ncbi:hypothetical protein Agabi119p4_2419 [Agaricus bisporus var. burnettii]|uniref:Core domain-containing protein n=1 Tax=Agaricus bisporus var. burnettii TaxID=192524 RepID=A0A8H7F951_AGABI|nr:hypothetical protein Agabi119p4_2419 [Agaricus bisporus var. burnettii]
MLRHTPRLTRAASPLIPRRISARISSPRLLTRSFPPISIARKLSTTTARYAALAGDTPGQSIVVLQTPSPEYLEQEEVDVELLPSDQIQLTITDRAAEQLRSIATRSGDPSAALRISVESGGCHGYQYNIQLAKEILPDDYRFSHPAVRPSNVVVDAVSLPLLNGSVRLAVAVDSAGSSSELGRAMKEVAHRPLLPGETIEAESSQSHMKTNIDRANRLS